MAKIVGRSAYAHRDYMHTLPDWALAVVSDIRQFTSLFNAGKNVWNVIKVERAYTKKSGELVPESVSVLLYIDFDLVDHPELLISHKMWPVMAPNGYTWILESKLTSFAERESPPILHRKELLVDETHPRYQHWAALTREEEEAGLLGRRGIGTKLAWERLLREKGYKVMFGNLVEYDHENDSA